MSHHFQKARKRNLDTIRRWITLLKAEHGDEVSIDRDQLIRKAQLVLGCSKRTANEYIELVLGVIE